MAKRVRDWWRQALRNLSSAEVNRSHGLHEEACYESHQAAEKALKALHQHLGSERRGHSLLYLLSELQLPDEPPKNVVDCARELDRHYIPSRYPDAYPEGAPMDYYGEEESHECIKCAELIVEWVGSLVGLGEEDL